MTADIYLRNNQQAISHASVKLHSVLSQKFMTLWLMETFDGSSIRQSPVSVG